MTAPALLLDGAPAVAAPHAPCAHCGLASARGARYCCFGCEVGARLAADAADGGRGERARLAFAAFLTMNLMVFTLVLYGDDVYGQTHAPHGAGGQLAGLFRWTAAVLATPVMALLAPPLARSAWARLREGRVTADLLIVGGTLAAYALSWVATLRGAGAVTFDAAAGLLALATAGRALEAAARRAAGRSLAAGLALGRDTAEVWSETTRRFESRATAEVRPGDRVRVAMGAAAPVDGIIEEGEGEATFAVITGESRHRRVRPGDELPAGAVPETAALITHATKDASGSLLGRLLALVHEARARRAPVERTADRLAAALMPVVIALAGVALVLGAHAGTASDGVMRALAVLLAACPCAFGVATPLALAVAMNRAAREGVLVRGADVLERAGRVRAAVLDKTGTLTAPNVNDVRLPAGASTTEHDVLAVAAALARSAAHPLSAAILELAAIARVAIPEASGVTRTTDGLAGLVDGARVTLGRQGDERLVVTREGRRLGAIEITERLLPGAREAVAALKRSGIEVHVASGDDAARVVMLARELGLPALGDARPPHKLALVEHLEARGLPVAVLGDGLNDAAASERATVGVAVAPGVPAAKALAGVTLMRADLRLFPWFVDLARRTRRVIRQNLAWAFAYNAGLVGLAVVGRLRPVHAGVAMLASSALVLANSWRLDAVPGLADEEARN